MDAIECFVGLQSWPEDASPWLQQVWREFVKEECAMTGLPEVLPVMPSGNGSILLGLNHAPLDETACQTFGETADLTQPCVRVLMTKFRTPMTKDGLTTISRRFKVPPRSSPNANNMKVPYSKFSVSK